MEQEWDKRGYYKVGNQKFYSKAQAILYDQQNHKGIDFIFNDEDFLSADLKNEPQESLDEIYKQRAQQLREKYDYLVLSYSSGVDSTNILHSFLYNNIHLDEVFCYGPFSTRQGKDGTLTKSAENNFREIDIVALPYLKELSKKYKFKVTLYDWTKDLINGFKSSDWIWTETQSRLSPSIVVRNRLHNGRAHLNLVDSGKKVCFIFGIDKPRINLKDNSYYFSFLDLCLNMGVGPGALATGSEWEFDEYFYWTKDMPKLIIKQSFVLKNFFENNPALKCYVRNSHMDVWAGKYKDNYFNLVNKIIYPTVNPHIWQTNKISSLTYTDHDNWFIKDENLVSNKIWRAGLFELQRALKPEYFNQGTVNKGFIGSCSKWYKIG